jgi:hypothetical protein
MKKYLALALLVLSLALAGCPKEDATEDTTGGSAATTTGSTDTNTPTDTTDK